MNIKDAFAPGRTYRWSDHGMPEEYKHERLDGVLIWPFQVDPATGRKITAIYRNELNNSTQLASGEPE